LHHVHGLVVAMITPLFAGACIEFLPKFSANAVWEKFMDEQNPITIFMVELFSLIFLLTQHISMRFEADSMVNS